MFCLAKAQLLYYDYICDKVKSMLQIFKCKKYIEFSFVSKSIRVPFCVTVCHVLKSLVKADDPACYMASRNCFCIQAPSREGGHTDWFI
jgi:hypothetical protein